MIPAELYEKLQELKDYVKQFGVSMEEICDEDLLLQVFIHKSYAADFRDKVTVPHNERLEFLGDSILGSVIAESLYNSFPEYSESQLTLSKIYLVKESTLAQAATKIGLGEKMFLGNGEEKMGGRDKSAILSDGLESLIAYIYLVSGRNTVASFINNHIYRLLKNEPTPTKSYKSQFQELAQKKFKEIPKYLMSEEEVEDSGNVLVYKAEVFIQGSVVAQGLGQSKKRAQEDAAQKAYMLMNPGSQEN